MSTEDVVKLLKTIKIKNIFKRSGIEHLRLFGSYAKNKANKQSDIDLLYKYNSKKDKSLWGVFSVYGHIQKDIPLAIDLVDQNIFNPKLRKDIFSSLVKIF